MQTLPQIAIFGLTASLAAAVVDANPGDLNRCIGPSGQAIYTDQSCAAMGASIRPQTPDIAGSNRATPAVRVHVRDCAATIPALRDGIQAALAAGDVNRLAGFFQWAGTSAREADGILDRLQTLTARPVLAVSVTHARTASDNANANAANSAANPPATGAAVAIVIDQARANGDSSPVRTVLAIDASMGCWWVRF